VLTVVAVAVAQEDNLDTLGKILPAVQLQPHHPMVENMVAEAVAEKHIANVAASAAMG
jgi:hypothetical protein